MQRVYTRLLLGHLSEDRQMVFLMGPRQVGQTTTARRCAASSPAHHYLTWDDPDDRRCILAGPRAVAERLSLDRLRESPPVCVLDELHKYGRWKGFLKGFFDRYAGRVRVVVTGSARLDVFRSGGDSLMGRYFGYRMHPLSVAEVASAELPAGLVPREPRPIDDAAFDALLRLGGFPEPFLRRDRRFWGRWRRQRSKLLFREDLRDLTRVRELGQVEVLAELVRRQVGQLVSYSSFSRAIGASVDSIRRWLQTLESLYYCFSVRPWRKNIARTLRKEPKYFLWDWSQVQDDGARAENLVASALLKAVHLWTDRGEGELGLYFIRDKDKREVDFVVVRDGDPWFLVEVKSAGRAALSPHLSRFQAQTGAPHAFQVALDLPFVARDCFALTAPTIVPARTFLSQLV